ncbi:MAG: MauE/DoxX family redox-associated membrane protein [Bacteroidales bacterium]|jgi:hypothetical protein|nr:MauE/DoxX family redox-associated membrane protein [Bacteroidales bacterium]
MKKVLSKHGHVIVQIISYLYIILFVYTAISKLLDFNDFRTQLGQSPVFAAIAELVSYIVIIAELLIAVLLAFDRTRKTGLVFAFTLMVMFTAYIIIILNFATFIPCSCGGFIESLSWTEHLIFNMAFILLALVAIYLSVKPIRITRFILAASALAVFGAAAVVLAYLWSDNQMGRNNAFVRKYIPHGLEKVEEHVLESNSYYLAGVDDHTIYLGNYTAPLYLKLVYATLNNEENVRVEIDNTDLPFKRVRIRVIPPCFFLGDGTVPVLFRGSINDWKAKTFSFDDAYFLQYLPTDSANLIISTTSTLTQAHALGWLTKTCDSVHLTLDTTILVKQLDGTFDTDGILLDNSEGLVVYVYHYRNAFEVADNRLNYRFTGKTIDTVSRVQLDVAYYEKASQYKIGSRSLMVNKTAACYGGYLYIHTDRLGRYEDDDVLRSAGIIDMYDIEEGKYLQSFYLYHQPQEKIRDFLVHKDRLIALVGDRLWIYRIKSEYYK